MTPARTATVSIASVSAATENNHNRVTMALAPWEDAPPGFDPREETTPHGMPRRNARRVRRQCTDREFGIMDLRGADA